MEGLINQVKESVYYWEHETDLHNKFEKVIKIYNSGSFSPIQLAKELVEIYDKAMSLPF